MKKKYKYIALASVAGISTFALYQYRKAKQIEKNTNDYISGTLEECSVQEWGDTPKRKYITLFKKRK